MRERIATPTTWNDILDVQYNDNRTIVRTAMTTEPSVVGGTRGTAYNYEAFTIASDTQTINQYYNIPIFIDEADRVQQDYVNAMSLAEFQGDKISEKLESLALAQHSSWMDFGLTDLNNTADDDTATITVSTSNVDDIIRAIKRKIYANNGVDFAVKNGLFIIWRAADFEMLEAFVQAGIKFIGLIKSSLINGEHLIVKAKATLSKALCQLQRLSERTLLMSEATVRTT